MSDKITSTPGVHVITLQRTMCSPEEAKKSPKYRLTAKFHLLSNFTTTNRSLINFKESGELGASNLAAVLQDLLKVDAVVLAQGMFLIGPRIFSALDGNFGSKIDFMLMAVLVSIVGGMKLFSSVRGTVESFLRFALFSFFLGGGDCWAQNNKSPGHSFLSLPSFLIFSLQVIFISECNSFS